MIAETGKEKMGQLKENSEVMFSIWHRKTKIKKKKHEKGQSVWQTASSSKSCTELMGWGEKIHKKLSLRT